MATNDRSHDTYAAGLRHAYGMKQQSLAVLTREIERLETYPPAQERLREHVGDTRLQIARLERLLSEAREQPSDLGDGFVEATAEVWSNKSRREGPDLLRAICSHIAFATYQIATYKTLINLARTAGQIAELPYLEQCLDEEKAMSSWLDAHLTRMAEQASRAGFHGAN